MEGWIDGWMEGNAILRIAYNYQKYTKQRVTPGAYVTNIFLGIITLFWS